MSCETSSHSCKGISLIAIWFWGLLRSTTKSCLINLSLERGYKWRLHTFFKWLISRWTLCFRIIDSNIAVITILHVIDRWNDRLVVSVYNSDFGIVLSTINVAIIVLGSKIWRSLSLIEFKLLVELESLFESTRTQWAFTSIFIETLWTTAHLMKWAIARS